MQTEIYFTLLMHVAQQCFGLGTSEFSGPKSVLTEVPRNSRQSFSGKWKNTWKETMAEFLRCRFRIVIIIRYFTNFAVKKIGAIET